MCCVVCVHTSLGILGGKVDTIEISDNICSIVHPTQVMVVEDGIMRELKIQNITAALLQNINIGWTIRLDRWWCMHQQLGNVLHYRNHSLVSLQISLIT